MEVYPLAVRPWTYLSPFSIARGLALVLALFSLLNLLGCCLRCAKLLDESGPNTEAKANSTATMFMERDFTRIIAVSHFDHLPRVNVTYSRVLHSARPALTFFTIAGQESSSLFQGSCNIARDIAGLYAYCSRPHWPNP